MPREPMGAGEAGEARAGQQQERAQTHHNGMARHSDPSVGLVATVPGRIASVSSRDNTSRVPSLIVDPVRIARISSVIHSSRIVAAVAIVAVTAVIRTSTRATHIPALRRLVVVPRGIVRAA